jgi:hypothetical protein
VDCDAGLKEEEEESSWISWCGVAADLSDEAIRVAVVASSIALDVPSLLVGR